MSGKLQPVDQNADMLRLRGLRLSYSLLVREKPISGKRTQTVETPYSIARAVSTALSYGRDYPNSYQPGYRVNVYLKG